jgi:hypothetical protein
MLKLKSFNQAVVIATLAALSNSCSARPSSLPVLESALPASWYVKPEDRGTLATQTDFEPSAKADRSVHAAFLASKGALDQLEEPMLSQTDALGLVPWHLDGMIADFAVSVNGVFGVLLGSGLASIKGTWQRPGAARAPVGPAPVKGSALHVSSTMSEADLAQQLEPAIQSAIATHAVQNEGALRKNIETKAKSFLAVCRALEQIHALPGWHVDGFQLQLTFNGQGHITPILGVGGAFNLYLDWEKKEPDSAASPSSAQSAGETPAPKADPILTEQLTSFSEIVAEEIPQAAAETAELQKSGLVLDQFQMGIAITAVGHVGLSQVQGVSTGKLIFKQNVASGAPQSAHSPAANPVAPGGKGAHFVNVIANEPTNAQLHFADQMGISFEKIATTVATESSLNDTVFRVERVKFHEGLKKAIRMATYFAAHALKVDSARWQITQLESEFDASIGGDVKLAVVSGTGQIVIDLDRPQP